MWNILAAGSHLLPKNELIYSRCTSDPSLLQVCEWPYSYHDYQVNICWTLFPRFSESTQPTCKSRSQLKQEAFVDSWLFFVPYSL